MKFPERNPMAIQELLPLLTEAIKTAETADVLSPEEWNGLDRRLQAIVLESLGTKSSKVEQK
jgi:hypothetical protein